MTSEEAFDLTLGIAKDALDLESTAEIIKNHLVPRS